eukprot:SAG11_NODE_36605_length_260_cov_3.298137_1_plen_37_part_01
MFTLDGNKDKLLLQVNLDMRPFTDNKKMRSYRTSRKI